jgi:hypothetical protein
MNIKVKCEHCNNMVLLTSSYKGQPIVCLDCCKKINDEINHMIEISK